MRRLVLFALLAVIGLGQVPWRLGVGPCCLLAGSSATPGVACAHCCAAQDAAPSGCCALASGRDRVVCTCDRRVPVAVSAPSPRLAAAIATTSLELHPSLAGPSVHLHHRPEWTGTARAGPTPRSPAGVALPIWLRDRHLLI